MGMVRFATTCDGRPHAGDEPCGKRSREYDSWPHCRECQDHCCPDHQAAGTIEGPDVDVPETCICLDCALEELVNANHASDCPVWVNEPCGCDLAGDDIDECPSCDGDGFNPAGGNCPRCNGGGRTDDRSYEDMVDSGAGFENCRLERDR